MRGLAAQRVRREGASRRAHEKTLRLRDEKSREILHSAGSVRDDGGLEWLPSSVSVQQEAAEDHGDADEAEKRAGKPEKLLLCDQSE
jgi:hypothetical protein